MEETGKTVIVPVEVDRDELWSAVMGSAFDTYSWWQEVQFRDGATWESPGLTGYVSVRVEDPNETEGSGAWLTFRIGMPELVKAISIAIEKGYRDPLVKRGTIGNAVQTMDFDATTGDIVMQCACFGEAVYG